MLVRKRETERMNRRDGGECLNRKAVNEPEFLSDILRAKSIKIFGINS